MITGLAPDGTMCVGSPSADGKFLVASCMHVVIYGLLMH